MYFDSDGTPHLLTDAGEQAQEQPLPRPAPQLGPLQRLIPPEGLPRPRG